MKRPLRILSAGSTTLALLFMAACGSGSGGSDGSTITIGVVIDETGELAGAAVPSMNGIRLAIDEANEAGGVDGKQIELVVEDGTSDPAVAAAAARTLSSRTDVVFGPASGTGCRAVQPILDQADVLQFCLSPQNFDLTDNFFWGLAPVTDYVAATAPWLESQNISTVAFIGVEGSAGDGYLSVFSYLEQTSPDQFEVVAEERFAAGSTSLETQMTRIRDSEPDLIVAGTTGGDIVPVAQAAKALGMTQPIWVGTGSASLQSLEPLAGDLPSGGLYANAFWVDVPDEIPSDVTYADEVTAFASAYEEEFGQPAVALAGGAYDAANLVIEALESGASSGPEITTWIEDSTFTGVLGDYTFAEDKHQGAQMVPAMMQYVGDDGFTLAFPGS